MARSKAWSTRSIRHSEFLDPEKYQELQNDTQGTFGGLGIVVAMKDNFVTVVAPMEDTPGFNAGILSGDRIIKIDGKTTENMSLRIPSKFCAATRNAGHASPFSGLRADRCKDYALTRAIIQMDMVKDINGKKEFPLGPDGIGYIRITEFGDRTSDELQDALDKLKAQGMKALILDLRFNPGGLLDEAAKVCQKFLPRGQLIVTTEGPDPAQDSVLRAKGWGDELKGMPMVVLVNLGSASASEIVSGCLQDLHRAVIMGEKTFGKGSVQSIIPLAERSTRCKPDRCQILHAQPQGHSRARHHAEHPGADVRGTGVRACCSRGCPAGWKRCLRPIAPGWRRSRTISTGSGRGFAQGNAALWRDEKVPVKMAAKQA